MEYARICGLRNVQGFAGKHPQVQEGGVPNGSSKVEQSYSEGRENEACAVGVGTGTRSVLTCVSPTRTKI